MTSSGSSREVKAPPKVLPQSLTGTIPAAYAPSWQSRLKGVLRRRELALVPAIILCVIVGAVVSDRFLTFENLINVLQQSTILGVLVIAASIILLCGKFDLSLESTFGLAPMIGVWAVVGATSTEQRINPWLGILIMLLVGAAVGAINGLLVVRYQMNAFIVTLAMLIILRGLCLLPSGGQTLYNLPPEMLYLGSATWFGIPVSVYIVGALWAGAAWFMRYHAKGRAMYALGGNEKAARAAGIPTRRLLFTVFVIGSVLAAFGGLLDAGRLASVSASQGEGMIFTTFAAAVIGGISLDGGKGTISGAMTGVLLLVLVQNVLVFAAVPSFWIDATYGLVILLALAIARFTSGERDL